MSSAIVLYFMCTLKDTRKIRFNLSCPLAKIDYDNERRIAGPE